MAWPNLLNLLAILSDIAALLREQNSLLREQIHHTTGRPPRTTPAPPLRTRVFPHSRPRTTPRTAADTVVMTPEAYRQQEIEAEKAARRGPGEPTNVDPTANRASAPPNPASR